jgi:hypothetical protein
VISFGGESLCAACDDGTHPPLPESHRAPVIIGPALELGADLTEAIAAGPNKILPFAEEPMTATDSRRGRSVDPEIKRAVLAASPTVSNGELARQYDISDKTVQKWRCAAGIRSTATRRLTRICVKPAEPPAPVDPPSSLMVDVLTPDAWWQRLSARDKAALFAANYVIRVEGTIS